MVDSRSLTHTQLAAIVADVQAILWQESRLLPDFPREYGEYWNPAKEWEVETLEQIAEVLDAGGHHWPHLPLLQRSLEMSALSVFKPEEPREKAEPLPAAALLGAAPKKPTKGTSHLSYIGPAAEPAARWLVLGHQAEEIERE